MNLNLAKFNLILEIKNNFMMPNDRGGQNGQKWPKNDMCFLALIMIRKTVGSISTSFLTISLIDWALGAYFFALMRN